MYVGDIVKLKNPKRKGEEKRRWRALGWHDKPEGTTVFNWKLRRLDTMHPVIELHPEDLFTPLSFWEKLKRMIASHCKELDI